MLEGAGSAKYYSLNQSGATSRQAASRTDLTDGGNGVTLNVENHLAETRLTYIPFCEGIPPLGSAVASVERICAGVDFELSLPSAQEGLKYKWQTSTDGILWIDLSGNFQYQSNLTVSLEQSLYYRVAVNCSISEDVQYSESVFVELIEPNQLGSVADITAQCIVHESDVNIPSTTDNCDGAVTVSHNATFPITAQGTTVITWTYTDVNGNTSTQTQNVVIEDNQSPILTVENISLELEGIGIATISPEMFEDWATDDCGVQNITLSQTYFDCDNLGDNVVTITVEDINGNISQENFIVTISDPNNLCQDLAIVDGGKINFTLYPNPARGKVFVKPSANTSVRRITIYSLAGEQIHSQLYHSISAEYEVDLKRLDAGSYILEIETSRGIYIKKILVKA